MSFQSFWLGIFQIRLGHVLYITFSFVSESSMFLPPKRILSLWLQLPFLSVSLKLSLLFLSLLFVSLLFVSLLFVSLLFVSLLFVLETDGPRNAFVCVPRLRVFQYKVIVI